MAKQKLHHAILSEVLIALKFATVGLVATAVHFTVALSLVSYYDIHPLGANLIAFLSAFVLSFWGNFNWTFDTTIEQRVALNKFFMVTFTAFIINNLLLIALIERSNLSKEWAVAIAAMVIPFITFITSRLWVFKVT